MKRERKEKRVKVEEGRWMPSCKAHRQSAVTPLDVLTEIALESRASVCSWLIRWIERLELSKRGKALRQASEQHCWETQGIIYQGRHVWLILQHTPALSFTQPPNSSFDTDTERKRSQAGTNIWVKTTAAAAAAANSQLVFTLNWNLSYSSKWGHQYSLWCPPPPFLPPASASDLRFIMGPDGEVDICIVTPQRRVTPMQSISQSINQSFHRFSGNYW